jgi:hypothetical protein
MLTFDVYPDFDRHQDKVHINPSAVASVRETECRPAFGGWWQVAVIRLIDGAEHVVCDGSRTAAKRIAEAQDQAQQPAREF